MEGGGRDAVFLQRVQGSGFGVQEKTSTGHLITKEQIRPSQRKQKVNAPVLAGLLNPEPRTLISGL
jgi:hypothetical protein